MNLLIRITARYDSTQENAAGRENSPSMLDMLGLFCVAGYDLVGAPTHLLLEVSEAGNLSSYDLAESIRQCASILSS